MARNCIFAAGLKTFEVVEVGDYWYEVIERRKNFVNIVSFDRISLLNLCRCMEDESTKKGKVCRNWKYQIENYTYHFYLNFNGMDRYIRVVAMKRSNKSTIIIPEIRENVGWSDYASKIRRFIEKGTYRAPVTERRKEDSGYVQIAHLSEWPKDKVKLIPEKDSAQNNFRIEKSSIKRRVGFLQKCLLGSFRHNTMTPPSCKEL